MIPPKVYELCRSGKSVSAEIEKNPSESPGEAAKRLFGVNFKEDILGEGIKHPEEGPQGLQQALECGNWGESKPSELFLQVCPPPPRLACVNIRVGLP